MKTYRLIVVLLLFMGIPAYLSYLAHEAAGIMYSSNGAVDPVWNVMVTAFAFVAAYIMMMIISSEYLGEYLSE